MRKLMVAGVAALAIGLAGCASGTDTGSAETPSQPSMSVSGDAANAAQFDQFAEAMFGSPQMDIAAASAMVAPGSPAADYMERQQELMNSGAGTSWEDGMTPTIMASNGGMTMTMQHPTSGEELVWSNPQFDDQGRIMSWDSNMDGPVESMMWDEDQHSSGMWHDGDTQHGMQ